MIHSTGNVKWYDPERGHGGDFRDGLPERYQSESRCFGDACVEAGLDARFVRRLLVRLTAAARRAG